MVSPETLRRYPLFSGIGENTLKQIAMMSEKQNIASGEWLFLEGDNADFLYIMLQGSLSLAFEAPVEGSSAYHVSTLSEGDVTGWSSVVSPHAYKLGAQALEDSTLVAIEAGSLRDILDENPVAGYYRMSPASSVSGSSTCARSS